MRACISRCRSLRRIKISEAQLPPGSVIRFKEVNYWEKHQWLILGVASAALVEALLFAGLFAQLRRRRQVEAFLRESEERLNLATTSSGAGLWAIDRTSRQIWLTERARQLFGPLGGKAPDWENPLSVIHPDDHDSCLQSVADACSSAEVAVSAETWEFRLNRVR